MTIWRWCGLFSVLMIAIAVSFRQIAGLSACGDGPLGEPIMSFEFVRNPDEVAALFNPGCRRAWAGAQYNGLLLDIFGFVPVYVATLLAALAALSRTVGARAFLFVGVTLTIVAAVCDQTENVQLLRILHALPGAPDMTSILVPAVRAKFALLALAVMCVGAMLLRVQGLVRWFAVPIVLGGALSLYGVVADARVIGLGGLMSWVCIALTAIVMSVRPRQALVSQVAS